MKILVIGSGGREHCLVWKLAQSREVNKIFSAPGNGGISELAECVDISPTDIKGLADFAKQKEIDLTVVGSEDPLVAGIVDEFESRGLKIFGPSKRGAKLEGSKIFAKELMRKYGIPTADFAVFDSFKKAIAYLQEIEFPCVLKADGLAGGKGSIVVHSKEEGESTINKMMIEKIFGAAGEKIIIEKFLTGQEASIIAVTDGKTILPLPSSQDHKQIYDGDRGPNTGGMGAYSPAPIVDKQRFDFSKEKILEGIIRGLREEGIIYKGIIYAGVMINKEEVKVLEFNVRFGDPETQAVLPRLNNDLVEILSATLDNRLEEIELDITPQSAVCVVLTSRGYPGKYERGKGVFGLDKIEDALVFHAGTRLVGSRQLAAGNEKFVTNGGRVLGITALGDSLGQAIDKVYREIDKIHFEGMQYRRDIGKKGLRV
ncbi:MAG: phosphoribosylamine--glycine ligase [Candidatus Omnitrophica bacterium 4484_213]|nr:MAG: phosphoribosylamine--glycine ligase [Candidatus Omnitrophica bacterium 4484_213]